MSGCVIQPAAPPPSRPVILGQSLPKPVWPDACVADWYAHATLPPCVESWIGDITRQQEIIEKKHKRKKSADGKSDK